MSKNKLVPEGSNFIDSSPHIAQRSKLKHELIIREFPWTEKQKGFLQLVFEEKNSKIFLIDGIWGVGKTMLAVYCCLQLLNKKKCSDIIYIRNPVESSTVGHIGLIPGTISEKFAPYANPCRSKLEELLTPAQANVLINEGRIEYLPIGFVRGASWNCKAVIADEASCFTKEDLFLIMSRMGEFSKLFIIGDSFQNDIGKKSGFLEVFNAFHNDPEAIQQGIFTMEFKDETDIVRSKLLRYLMKKFRSMQRKLY